MTLSLPMTLDELITAFWFFFQKENYLETNLFIILGFILQFFLTFYIYYILF